MKTIRLKSLFLFLFFVVNSSVFAQSNLVQQLTEINSFWNVENYSSQIDELPALTVNSDRLIQIHLELVENELRRRKTDFLTEDQKSKRLAGLAILKEYRQKGVFPVNTGHDYRIPYFVDDFNTACAVGHIMREGGAIELVEQIVQSMNNAYIEEIPADQIKKWSNDNGFTVAELKWIQPSYEAVGVYPTIEPSTCNESDGVVSVYVYPGWILNWNSDTELLLQWLVDGEAVESSVGVEDEDPVYSNYTAGRYDIRIMLPAQNLWIQRAILLSDQGAPELTPLLTPGTTDNPFGGNFTVSFDNSEDYEFEWTNVIGEVLSNNNSLHGVRYWTDALGQSENNVFLQLTDSDGCQFHYEYGLDHNLDCINPFYADIQTSSCGGSSGSIFPMVGEEVVDFVWSNGTTEKMLDGVGEGEYSVIATDVNGCSITMKYFVPSQCFLSGIVETSAHVSVYPNPADDFVQVELEEISCFEYSLFDQSGRELLQEKIESESKLKIDLAEFDTGLYILMMQTNAGSVAKRVLLN